jgi:exopolyphosphatase / guanosine-5'-triphosphate,3'-diphosphate pyrophosphatase
VAYNDKLQLTAPFRLTRESPNQAPATNDETVAVIDIGSNTCRLVVAKLWPDWGFVILEETEASVRLAPTRPDKPIGRKALERAQRAFAEFRSIADSYNPGTRLYVATAAVRQAPNCDRVVRLFEEWLGAEVTVISAVEEAEYAVVAAINSLPALSGTVVDLGGGSAQVATYLGPAMTSSYSFPIGALLMQQRFLGSDPPKAREIKQLRSHVRGVLEDARLHLPQPVIFIGGTVRALARLQQRLSGYRLGWPHGYTFTAFQLSRLAERLSTSTVSEIARLPGVGSDRAEILAAGALVLDEFCRTMSVKRLTVSGEGIRHGLLYRELERRGRSPGAARDRTIRTLRASHKEPPYIEAARTIARDIITAIPGLEPEVSALLPVAVELHRIGDTINVHKSDRSGQSIVASSELPGFSQREALLLALTLGSQESFRASKSDFGQPLQPADRALVARLSALLRLTVLLARPLRGRVFFFHDGEVLRVTTPVVPFEAEALSARLQDAFGFDTDFVLAGGDQEKGAERSSSA